MKLKQLAKKIMIFAVALFTFVVFNSSKPAYAASYIWDGGGATSNWSDCDNWSANICPTAADNVIFNATSVKDASINTGFTGTILGLTIASGYTGSIMQERDLIANSFAQAAGAYNAGNHNLTIRAGFLTSGGTFTAPSETLDLWGQFTIGAANQFIHNNGTVIFWWYR